MLLPQLTLCPLLAFASTGDDEEVIASAFSIRALGVRDDGVVAYLSGAYREPLELFVARPGKEPKSLGIPEHSKGAVRGFDNGVFVGSRLVHARDSNGYDSEVWVTDVDAGVHTVLGTGSDGLPKLIAAEDITAFGDRVIFGAAAEGGTETLWISDGTADGTQQLHDGNGRVRLGPNQLAVVGARVVFAFEPALADVGVGKPHPGKELWVTDGTRAGTKMLKNIHPKKGSSIARLQSNGSIAVFVATDGSRVVKFASTPSIWVTDGTTSGTRILWNPPDRHTVVSEFFRFGAGRVVATIQDAERQRYNVSIALDGSGATRVDSTGVDNPYPLAQFDGGTFFRGSSEGRGGVFFVRDGESTRVITNSGQHSSGPIVAEDGAIYYGIADSVYRLSTREAETLRVHDGGTISRPILAGDAFLIVHESDSKSRLVRYSR